MGYPKLNVNEIQLPKIVVNTLHCNAADLPNISTISGIDVVTSIVIYGQISDLTKLKDLRDNNGPMSALQNISLPDQTGSIISQCFYYCGWMKRFSAPNITKIKDYAFFSCSDLIFIDLPKVTIIGEYAFAYSDSLTAISLPETTIMGYAAFAYCYSLTTISLASVTTIGYNCFFCCTSLMDVTFGVEITSFADIVFGSMMTTKITLHLLNPVEYSKATDIKDNDTNNEEPGLIVKWYGLTFKQILNY